MRLFVLSLLLTVNVLGSAGQVPDLLADLENDVLQIRQKPGTDRLLRSWLEDAGVTEDTVYAYIYAPGSCPRCESSITSYRKYVSSNGGKFLLITVLRDKEAAVFYNRKKNYTADYYIYDTDDYYKNVFSFNNVALNSSNMLKLTGKGRLVTGYDGINYSAELAGQLMRRTVPMEYRDFGLNVESDSAAWVYRADCSGALPLRGGYKDYRIDVAPEAPLCEIYRNPYFCGDVFFYPDELQGGVPVFRKKKDMCEMAFEGTLGPDSVEKRMFIDLDADTYNMLYREDNLYYIVCNAGMLDGRHIGLSYSLPMIFFESDDRVAYFNKPCILSRDIDGFGKSRSFIPDYDTREESFFYSHFQFASTGGRIIMGCQKKTWPMSFEPEEYKDNVAFNPFCAGFYDTDNPFMAEFDRHTGRLVRRFGHLDSVAAKTLTGYYYVSPLSVAGGGELAYTDGYSGKVYVADTSAVTEAKACYSVFSIRDEDLPPADSSLFYTYDHAKRYRGVFCRCITDMMITSGALYCVVAYGDMSNPNDGRTRYTFVTIDRHTGARREYMYPEEDGYTVFARGLREKDGRVWPFNVLKRGGEALLRVYGEDGAEL